MNFVRDRELAQRFRNGAVSSRERLLYYLIVMTVTTVLFSSFFTAGAEEEGASRWDLVLDIFYIVVQLVGVLVCYSTNRRGDDREFIERMVCIGFPVGVQTFLICIPIIGYYVVASFFLPETDLSGYPYILPGVTLPVIYYYWRLNASIRVAAG
ncbi:hypothetical protein [Chelativorans sp. M5D2P16]|uniref:hypothetical protein n=1 Tax=Chelativorans sp. M5D2P16 TaxID=3095678 RepID=UPI002ACA7805|nr:hypothetical protein [Chelativorans sp. M5D2P16]MDZ5696807.1 hypothetical protein [Chelativorans sp. M5D2P16]